VLSRDSSSSCNCGWVELEERKSCKTRATGAGEVRAGFERLSGEPKGVSFEEGEYGAVFAIRRLELRAWW